MQDPKELSQLDNGELSDPQSPTPPTYHEGGEGHLKMILLPFLKIICYQQWMAFPMLPPMQERNF